MLVTTKHFGQVVGSETSRTSIWVASKVSRWAITFAYSATNGETNETPIRTKHTTYEMYGFGTDPVHYTWKDLPREVLGEGIVVRVGPNAADCDADARSGVRFSPGTT